jgi:hypothetical protein
MEGRIAADAWRRYVDAVRLAAEELNAERSDGAEPLRITRFQIYRSESFAARAWWPPGTPSS